MNVLEFWRSIPARACAELRRAGDPILLESAGVALALDAYRRIPWQITRHVVCTEALEDGYQLPQLGRHSPFN
jgi:hypothetical protein